MSQQSESSTDTGLEEPGNEDPNYTIVTRNKRKKRTKNRDDSAKKVDDKKSPEIRFEEAQLPTISQITHESSNTLMETETSEINNPTTTNKNNNKTFLQKICEFISHNTYS